MILIDQISMDLSFASIICLTMFVLYVRSGPPWGGKEISESHRFSLYTVSARYNQCVICFVDFEEAKK